MEGEKERERVMEREGWEKRERGREGSDEGGIESEGGRKRQGRKGVSENMSELMLYILRVPNYYITGT